MVARLLIFCLLLVAVPAYAQNFPKLTGRVVDAADLLTSGQEVALGAKLQVLEQSNSRQLVVATVPDLQGREIEDYGYQLGRAWGIGQKEADNGAILLVAPNEKKVRIEVGYGLEPILTDAFSSLVIQNQILPRFRENDFPGGIDAGADAIIAQLQAPPEVAERKAAEAAAKRRESSARAGASRGGGGVSILSLIFWGFILFFVILPMFFGRGRRSRRGPWGGRRYGGSALPIILWNVANEIGRSSGRGGGGGGFGGFGGGGGGGFGGFSGGGGSFGGGGASGGW
jgi:uncharacterized protein